MKTTLRFALLFSCIFVSGCATYGRRWALDPSNKTQMAQFYADRDVCVNVVQGFSNAENLVDRCLAMKGYKVDVYEE